MSGAECQLVTFNETDSGLVVGIYVRGGVDNGIEICASYEVF